MIKLKDGVDWAAIDGRLVEAAVEVEKVFRRWGVGTIITSGRDGDHMRGSFHYKGLALDFRTRHLRSKARAAELHMEVQRILGADFDCILHSTHLHVEYDPYPRDTERA